MQFVTLDVHDVTRTDLLPLLAQRHHRPPGHDHDPVVVRVALARRATARRDVEVAHPVVARALRRPNQLVLLDPGDVLTVKTPALCR